MVLKNAVDPQGQYRRPIFWCIAASLCVESVTTTATSHTYHSEAEWTIGRAFFPTRGFYGEERLVYWIVAALIAGLLIRVSAKMRLRDLCVWLGLTLLGEILVTVASSQFPDPGKHEGFIEFATFSMYLFARLGVWFPLALIVGAVLFRQRRGLGIDKKV